MNGSTLLAALVGPTAVGKTALSLDLAEALNAEILSCDSMQVYTSMDIGTAKPTVKERRGIPHHLIDLVPPTSEFSSADYKRLAVSCIKEVTGRGRLPLFCGGTGLYLDTVTRVSSLAPDIPAELRDELSKKDGDDLYDELLRIDPTAAAATHKNNRKRVIRALELYYGTGKTKTEWDLLSQKEQNPYDTLVFGLDFRCRDLLYRRIDERVDEMVKDGLIEEVASLPVPLSKTAAQAIGYKEILLYLDGTLPLSDAIALLKQNTRRYAKRQLTWFRRDPRVVWFYPDETSRQEIFENIVNIIRAYLNR